MERPVKSSTKEPVPPSPSFVAPSREELMKDVQGVIVQAFKARTEYVRQETNIITLASLRRILEKDLNVESGFLDTYKEFVRGLIKELLQGPEEHSPQTGKVIDEPDPDKGKETVIEEPEPESEGIVEDPKPKMKRLKKMAGSEEMEDEVIVPVEVVKAEEEVEVDIEGRIWRAAQKRAFQFKAEAETLTVKKVRRLLEQDLELENGALDAYKNHIRATLDEILNAENAENAESPENEEPTLVAENAESPENEESTHVSYCEVRAPKAKKRKAAAPESVKKPSKKQKPASGEDVEESDSIYGEGIPKVQKGKTSKKKVMLQEDQVASGDGDEEPSEKDISSADDADDERPERKKVSKSKPVESKPAYSRKVEHLKNIIKDCGITVPPSVYKKAKQAGESRREGIMISELEAILHKEGLTASASRDEIKAVRKRKEKLKDLEGIDTSNIIEETRGRRSRTSANSFFAPRRNDPIDLGDEDEGEDEDEDGEDEDDDDNSEGDPDVELQDDDDDED